MPDYYSEKLSAERLYRVYEIAPPRVKQYFDSEIDFVLEYIEPGYSLLELGCGYGRVLPRFAEKAREITGIDTSITNLALGREMFASRFNLVCADAVRLPFADASFHCVVCIQNGISAFHVNQRELIEEAIRVIRKGGRALFSSYSDKFWDDRFHWFQLQADEGLLGEIDYERTGHGEIVCKDGFTATTIRPADFERITANLGVRIAITEVDDSSLFCVINK